MPYLQVVCLIWRWYANIVWMLYAVPCMVCQELNGLFLWIFEDLEPSIVRQGHTLIHLSPRHHYTTTMCGFSGAGGHLVLHVVEYWLFSLFRFLSSSASTQLNSTSTKSKAEVSYILKQIQPPTHPPTRPDQQRKETISISISTQTKAEIKFIVKQILLPTHKPQDYVKTIFRLIQFN